MKFNIRVTEPDFGLYSICVETDNPSIQISGKQRFVQNVIMTGENDNAKVAEALRRLANMMEFRWENLGDDL